MCSIPVTVFILKVPFFTISRMPGMRKSAWPSGAKFPLPGNPVSGWPKLSQAVCAVCSCAPGVINHHPGGAALQSRAECHRKGWLCPPRQKALLYKGVFLGYLAPAGTPPGARKRSGKNLVFPRGPAAASASDMIVISALCRNNTPPMAQEGPSGFRRWEETWGNTRRSGCSGPYEVIF